MENIKTVQEYYPKKKADRYKETDFSEKNKKARKHRDKIIFDICNSFNKEIDVLDVGCGSGRYFHAVRNFRKLVGIDVNHFMLEYAENPALMDKSSLSKIYLIKGDIYHTDLGSELYDFIYSIGVLGEHSPFTRYICDKIFDAMKIGGKFFITIADEEYVKWTPFGMNKSSVINIINESKFEEYDLKHYIVSGPNWKGAHFEIFGKR